MPLYIAQSGDLDMCYRCLTDSLTTLKDRATQLLIKYKSGALVTQLENHIGGFPNPNRNFFWGGRRGRAVGCYHILLQSRFSLPDDTCKLAKRKVLTLRPTSQNGPEGSLTVLMIQNSPERSIFGNSKTCFKFLFWSYGPLVANDNS